MGREGADWVIEETTSADFGDKRLNKRYEGLLGQFASHPSKSIPASSKGWAETVAAYRFFNHPSVSVDSILSPHKEATLERIKQEQLILIPQDTTEMNFTGRAPIEGMGYLSSELRQGFYLHPSLAVTPEGVCLGVVDLQTWTREQLGERSKRKKKSIEEKESYCWVRGYEAANEVALACPDTQIVSVSDREGDLYELLEKLPSSANRAYWLVRCHHNRSIKDPSEEELSCRLKDTVSQTKVRAHVEFDLPAGRTYNRDKSKRRPRKVRRVKQAIRYGSFTLKPPQNKKKDSTPVTIHVVHCKEIHPPSQEDALEWFLLTSFPVETVECAKEVVKWYLCRWQIEVFFKVLKSGCGVERLQFETFEATRNCVALYLIVAWRVMYLTMLGRHCPDIPCEVVFESFEWQSVYSVVNKKPPPTAPPKLSEMVLMIAQLGGFLGRKSDGFPGSKVMWIGLQRAKDFALSWQTFHAIERKKTYV